MAGRTVKTEAIVLRSLRFSEADRILHLYTEQRGRVGAIAKGVPVEVLERGVVVNDEDGPDGPYEHGVLELAYTLGSVDADDSPVGKRPRKIVVVRRNLENAAGDDEGLRDAITAAVHDAIGLFEQRASASAD